MRFHNTLPTRPLGQAKYVSLIVVLIAIFVFATALQYSLKSTKLRFVSSEAIGALLSEPKIPSHINMIDLDAPITDEFTCIKTKLLLNVLRTTICVHNDSDMLSSAVIKDKIWEEANLGVLFRVLFRYPEFSFIDVGANIGTYTMFAASLGRSVLAIECFQPNYLRIAKALQMENVTDRVALIGNAIFARSGETMQLKSVPTNIGGQFINAGGVLSQSLNDPYSVKTIRFNDIIPILKQRNIRSVVMKVDIEGSENFLCDGGGEAFDYLDVTVILMEWANMKLVRDRASTVLTFFTQRHFVPTTDTCQEINIKDAFTTWPWDIYWVKKNRLNIC